MRNFNRDWTEDDGAPFKELMESDIPTETLAFVAVYGVDIFNGTPMWTAISSVSLESASEYYQMLKEEDPAEWRSEACIVLQLGGWTISRLKDSQTN